MEERSRPVARRDIDKPRKGSILVLAFLALVYMVLFAGCSYALFFQSPDGGTTLGKHRLLFESATVLRDDGLGDEWSLRAAISGDGFSPGTTKYVEPSALPLNIALIAIASGSSYDVIGNGNLPIPSYEKGERYAQTVTVTKTKGADAGRTATVEFVFVWR